MKTGVKGIEVVKSYEGLYLKAYRCPANVWTIGYGHTYQVTEGMEITQKQADSYLRWDLQTAENCVNLLPNINLLNQNQFDALVSFAFNLGCGNFKTSTLRKKVILNPIDDTIRFEFNRWIYAKGKKLNGLIRRRNEEADLYFTIFKLPKCVLCGR